MRFVMLLRPHANARYEEAVLPLAEKELLLTIGQIMPGSGDHTVRHIDIMGTRAIEFVLSEMPEALTKAISGHSALLLFCEYRDDGSLVPLAGPAVPELGDDLSAILKYKGKTNERFTRFLIHMALLSAHVHSPEGKRLVFADPMCGKGTAVFEAVNMGMDAYGADTDGKAVAEANAFYRKYLEYHRIKHANKEMSMTIPGGKSAPVRSVSASGKGEVRFAVCDAGDAAYVFGKGRVHIMAADLPYGVQHAPNERGHVTSMSAMLEKLMSGVYASLAVGGAAAFSFNVNTLPREKVASAAMHAGLRPASGPCYEGLEHWVEQAVRRDVCVAVKD